MPGNPHIHPFDKLGDIRKLLSRIIQPGDDQGSHLHPDPQLLEAHNGVQHRLQRGLTDLAVMIIPKTLQIHIVGINKFGKGLGRGLHHKAVGYKDVAQPLGPGQPRRVLGELQKDGGFGVGIGNAGRLALSGGGYDVLRRSEQADNISLMETGYWEIS